MRLTEPLKDHQLAVLQWISHGCPADVMDGSGYKRTSHALQDRKLAMVSRRGGTWSATLTDSGRYYMEHGTYPEPASHPSPGAARSRRRKTAEAAPRSHCCS